jgi:hypothetical protein
MPMTLEQIVEETRKLPPEQLSELIERITLAAHAPIDLKVEEAWTDTAMHRLAEPYLCKIGCRIGRLGSWS